MTKTSSIAYIKMTRYKAPLCFSDADIPALAAEVSRLLEIEARAQGMAKDKATCCADEDLAEMRREVARYILTGEKR
jgi:hypothetical protein